MSFPRTARQSLLSASAGRRDFSASSFVVSLLIPSWFVYFRAISSYLLFHTASSSSAVSKASTSPSRKSSSCLCPLIAAAASHRHPSPGLLPLYSHCSYLSTLTTPASPLSLLLHLIVAVSQGIIQSPHLLTSSSLVLVLTLKLCLCLLQIGKGCLERSPVLCRLLVQLFQLDRLFQRSRPRLQGLLVLLSPLLILVTNQQHASS